ncbi:MAG: CHAT domain-containing protein [Planctomycetota bacterium]
MLVELGQPASNREALQDLAGLLGDRAAVRSLRAQPEQVHAAIAAARPGVDGALASCFESMVATCLASFGQHDAARSLLERFFGGVGAVDHEDPGWRWHASGGLRLLAELQHRAGAYDAALATARRAAAVAIGLGREVPSWRASMDAKCADATGVEARVLIDTGRIAGAWDLLQRQRRLLEAAGSAAKKPSRMRAALFLAEYFATQDRYAKALSVLQDAGSPDGGASDPGSQDALMQIQSDRLRVLIDEEEDPVRRRHGDVAALAAAADRAASLTRLLAEEDVDAGFVEGARLVLMRAAIARGDHDAARAELAALRALRGAAVDRPFDAELTMLETRLLLATTPRAGAGPDQVAGLRRQFDAHERAFAALLQEWRDTAPPPGGLGFLARGGRRRILTELVQLCQRLHDLGAGDGLPTPARCAAERLLQMQELTSTARAMGVSPADLAQVRAEFARPGQGVLCLIAEPSQSMLVAIDADCERLFWLPGSRVLAEPVEVLLRELQHGADDRAGDGAATWSAAQAAAELVLPGEVRPLLREWDGVTVADYGMLGGMPWECLPVANDALLGEVVAVNTLTSLPLGVAIAGRMQPPVAADRARLQLVGTLLGAGPGADKAAPQPIDPRVVQRLFSGFAVRTPILDQAATAARVRQLALDASVNLVLAHGAEVQDERPAGLALTPGDIDDGLFGCADVEAMAAAGLPVQGLVILSVCGAGRGRRQPGDEALHATLGGAFLMAGAHTVVQSRADLHLLAHVRLLERAFAELQRGASTAAAFRAARRALAADGAGRAERFEHAQVQVFGLGLRPVFCR